MATAAFRIRRAAPADLDALVELEQASFDKDRLSRRQYRHHLRSATASVLAAVDDSRLLGSAVIFFRRRSSAARLYSIAVAAGMRGRGIAAALLEAAEQAARTRGSNCLRLEVRQDNPDAIRLYERRGYRRFATCRGFYEDGADAWRYQKGLRTEG